MSSASFAEPLGIWLAQRMRPGLFGIAAGVVLCGAAAGGSPTPGWLPAACAAALLLLFQFRLWDDLADVSRDRVEHPERFLPNWESTAVFRAAIWLAGAVNLLAIALLSGPLAALALLALNGGFALWYRLSAERRGGLLGSLVVLLKYPVFTALLAPAPLAAIALAFSCAAVYYVFCVYEWRTA